VPRAIDKLYLGPGLYKDTNLGCYFLLNLKELPGATFIGLRLITK